jgi:short-subunit dehydrogenase
MDNKKIAVITGASRGIGESIADAFAAKGFDLILTARNAELLSDVSNRLESKHSNRVWKIASDLSTENGCTDFVRQVKELNLEIDVLVNNAGVFLPGTLMDEPVGQMEMQMQTNFFSAYYVTRGLWSKLKKQDRSHVFNMCSIASILAYEAGGGYAVTKHALLGFSKSLRREGIPLGIRVSAVLPGATLTDSWAGVDLPESRFMRVEDVAKCILTAWEINLTTVMEEIIIRPIEGDI